MEEKTRAQLESELRVTQVMGKIAQKKLAAEKARRLKAELQLYNFLRLKGPKPR